MFVELNLASYNQCFYSMDICRIALDMVYTNGQHRKYQQRMLDSNHQYS